MNEFECVVAGKPHMRVNWSVIIEKDTNYIKYYSTGRIPKGLMMTTITRDLLVEPDI